MWTYKTYFDDAGEFFEYDTYGGQGPAVAQKVFPYLESLLSFLELDHEKWGPLMRQASEDLKQYFATRDLTYTDHAMQLLGELAEKHIYFKLLYLQCFWRKAEGTMEPRMAEEMRLLPEQLSLYQKQARTFLENMLDIDPGRTGRAEKCA